MFTKLVLIALAADLGGVPAFIGGIKAIHQQGGKIIVYVEAFIILNKAGSDILFQIHYTSTESRKKIGRKSDSFSPSSQPRNR